MVLHNPLGGKDLRGISIVTLGCQTQKTSCYGGVSTGEGSSSSSEGRDRQQGRALKKAIRLKRSQFHE